MSQAATAVVDLDTYRRARQLRAERPRSAVPPRPTLPTLWMPVVVTWVPVWPVVA